MDLEPPGSFERDPPPLQLCPLWSGKFRFELQTKTVQRPSVKMFGKIWDRLQNRIERVTVTMTCECREEEQAANESARFVLVPNRKPSPHWMWWCLRIENHLSVAPTEFSSPKYKRKVFELYPIYIQQNNKTWILIELLLPSIWRLFAINWYNVAEDLIRLPDGATGSRNFVSKSFDKGSIPKHKCLESSIQHIRDRWFYIRNSLLARSRRRRLSIRIYATTGRSICMHQDASRCHTRADWWCEV